MSRKRRPPSPLLSYVIELTTDRGTFTYTFEAPDGVMALLAAETAARGDHQASLIYLSVVQRAPRQ